MPNAYLAPLTNQLVDGLPHNQRYRFMAQCELVELEFGTVLCEEGMRYRHAYFPLSAFISLLTSVTGHPPLEMGLIGSEGMLGATLALGINVSPLRAVVQGPGSALRMTTEQLRATVNDCPKLASIFNRYLYVLMAQLAQTAACTHFHEIEARLARWLLMTHDRAHGDRFHLTHQFLADMLGVQRSAVTIAAGALQKRKLIHYSRGEINIVSRDGLEAASCECYAAVIKDYSERFGTSQRLPKSRVKKAVTLGPLATELHALPLEN